MCTVKYNILCVCASVRTYVMSVMCALHIYVHSSVLHTCVCECVRAQTNSNFCILNIQLTEYSNTLFWLFVSIGHNIVSIKLLCMAFTIMHKNKMP